jgi:hypothetical protein
MGTEPTDTCYRTSRNQDAVRRSCIAWWAGIDQARRVIIVPFFVVVVFSGATSMDDGMGPHVIRVRLPVGSALILDDDICC